MINVGLFEDFKWILIVVLNCILFGFQCIIMRSNMRGFFYYYVEEGYYF